MRRVAVNTATALVNGNWHRWLGDVLSWSELRGEETMKYASILAYGNSSRSSSSSTTSDGACWH